jgi:hypothetical protein
MLRADRTTAHTPYHDRLLANGIHKYALEQCWQEHRQLVIEQCCGRSSGIILTYRRGLMARVGMHVGCLRRFPLRKIPIIGELERVAVTPPLARAGAICALCHAGRAVWVVYGGPVISLAPPYHPHYKSL